MAKRRYASSISFYRASRWFYLHKLKLVAQIIYRLNYILFNCVVPPSADIAGGVDFGHSVGIVIHDKAVIGEKTKIYQNVTIGKGPRRVIGSNCVIGTGAVVLADIGDNVNIGANAVVLDPIPDNCTAVGIPARIVKRENENEINFNA